MTDLDRLTAWINGYLRAWNTNDPSAIGELFAADADYYTEPFGAPWHGRERIVRGWLARQDEPGETTFDWSPIVVTPEVAVVRGTTNYPDRVFSNLWVIRLDGDGRCLEFTEWWMQHPG
jgi:uncharacterized protein (TIGR02246 family)